MSSTPSSDGWQILPTQRCFDDVADWLREFGVKLPLHELVKFYVCHGICVGFDVGPRAGPQSAYAHAWLRHEDGYVLDFGLDSRTRERVILKIEHDDFYTGRNVQVEVVYHVREAALASAIAGGSGPWRHFIRKLTNDADHKRFPPEVAQLGRQVFYSPTRKTPASSPSR